MKKLAAFLALALIVSLFAGCVATPVVYYSDCTCPTGSHTAQPTDPVDIPEGAVKTGLAIVTTVSGENASAEADGDVTYDVTIAAVTINDDGIIVDCKIDSLGTSVNFSNSGAITTDLEAEIKTKYELGYDYGMVAYKVSEMEWFEQADALAHYAVGKTVEELKNGAVDENGYAVDVDLASSATIRLGDYVAAIEKAAANAKHLGAQTGDKLEIAVIANAKSSTAASEGKAGNAQLDVDAVALTMNDGIITSCVIDSLQAKVDFAADGQITFDLTAPVKTKTELGYDYGMVAYKVSELEWFEQVSNFCTYVTGKTPAQVAGIAVTETTAPVDADLASGCTIAIGGFQALIQKAAQE